MEQDLLPDIAANGGWPEPPTGEPVRVVAARHDACASETRVRLPWPVPARAVRRVRCSGCSRDFETETVEELTPAPPRRLAVVDRFDPSSRAWQLASLALAAAAVIGGLMLIQGGDDQPQTAQTPAAVASQSTPPPAADGGKADHKGGHKAGSGQSKASNHTTLVSGSSFNLVLPAHWAQVDPPTGATFKAVSPDGDADATLWIKRDPSLTFDQFVDQSRDQLAALSGTKPEVIEQGPAPSTDEAVVKLAADAPAGQPTYQVTLRASGDYRYYLAITTQPDASTEATIGANLIDGSFTPEGSE